MDNLEALAGDIAAAQVSANAAASAVNDALAHRGQINSRIAALTGEHEAIKARRAAGAVADDDGAKLATIAVDTESLQATLPTAEAKVIEAHARVQQANAALAAATAEYKVEESRLTLQAMDDHADQLLALLEDTVARRLAAGAAMPRGDKAFHRGTAQLEAFDRIASAQMHALRVASSGLGVAGAQARWIPSDMLYQNVWRLHETGGTFA